MNRDRLGVFVDGAPMADEEARAFWKRFSEYMESHKGDLAGFAAQEGFASVRPEMRGGQAVLIVSRTAAQTPYATAKQQDAAAKSPHAGGSKRDRGHQSAAPKREPQPRKYPKS